MTLRAPDLSLANTLGCGQVFCWRQEPDAWRGWIGDVPVRVRHDGVSLHVEPLHGTVTTAQVRHYFGLNDDLDAILATFPKDEWMRRATDYARGMRLLRQPVWECLAGFICSALKQVPHIMQINAALRAELGEPTPAGPRFPSFERLAASDEATLRRLKLGFRARNLHRTAQQLAAGEVSLPALAQYDDTAAANALQRLAGVGPKIANCVMLFALTRWTAFPVDTWIARGLRTLYFPRKRKVTLPFLQAFAADYFGPYGGVAQQYLFHWLRSHGRGPLPNEKR